MSLLAMRNTDREGLGTLIARRRVERGIRWLNTVRPHDWWRTLYHPTNGRFLARDQYAEECALALAFKSEDSLRNSVLGQVTYAQVANHLGFESRWFIAHGFLLPMRVRRHPVSPEHLNAAWEQEVRHSPLIVRRELLFPEAPSLAKQKRRNWVQGMMKHLRIRRILDQARPLRDSHA